MTTITREQAQKIIEAADEVISALAGTNEDVHPGSDNMLRLWDDLNDRYAPPEVVRELARIALASLEQNALSGNSPLIPGEVLSAIREVARIRADFDDFDGDRRGIGDCLDEAEQELIVTINKYASQLAVEPVVPDDVLEQTVASPAPGNQVSELTMWVKRLAHSLKYANSLSSLPDKAMEYLNQNGLISVEDVLR